MRVSVRVILRVGLVVVAVAILCVRLIPRHGRPQNLVPHQRSVPDLSVTQPLNQAGGGAAPADAYAVYSALYQTPAGEPLVFDEDSGTDIPQVGGSCLRPKTEDERQMTEAFEAANRMSHRWERRFVIPQDYRLLDNGATGKALECLGSHEQGGACAAYAGVQHVRFLGVPGFDAAHTHALVSVIRKCGGFCGSGGIFEVEKTGGTWQRVAVTEFVEDCSWAY
ncbi:MAG TPA: hypothetical protein VHX37_11070 [Acidobacteriaceae bacterium]|jgi:hypothetical protein|nr:hypothetical protein [Acidobacteriaceae bacterium]